MNKIVSLLVFSLFLFPSCGDDSPVDKYPVNKDIVFTVNSTDESRRSEISTLISNGIDQGGSYDIHITESSLSEYNLPFSRSYLNQTVKYATNLGVSYRDDSETLSAPFESYTVTMTIRVDGETVATDEYQVEESGQVLNTGYLLN